MKKLFIILLIACLPLLSVACDICGCGVGGNYVGILPDFTKHIAGLRFRTNSLTTHLGIGGAQTYLTTKETYRTAELWGGWNITDHIRVMASVPYSFNQRINQGSTKEKHGLGDISVSGFYRLLHGRRTLGSKLFIHTLWAGLGVKLPTGTYSPADKSQNTQSANLFQLGTGSIDISANAMYDARLQDAGINLSANYKLNTTNKYHYRYGSKFTISAQPYYKFSIKQRLTIAPNAGILYEVAQKDTDNSFPVDISGGNILLGTIGVEVSFKKVALGANYQSPLSQKLALGIVRANDRGMVHIGFAL